MPDFQRNAVRDRIRRLIHIKRALTNTRFTQPALGALIAPGDVVIDAGAQLGQFSRRASRIGARCYAFEPGAYQRSILEIVVRWRRLSGVVIRSEALGETTEDMTLTTPVKSRGGRGIGRSSVALDPDRPVYSQESVRVRRLDDLAAEIDFNGLSFIKADVEGSEGRMLRGGAALIERHKPSMVLEMGDDVLGHAGDSVAGVSTWLRDRGYAAYVLSPDGASFIAVTPEEIAPLDAYWIHETRRATLSPALFPSG